MIGGNELHLNKATIIEALNFWLKSKFYIGKEPIVVDVREATTSNTFIVKIERTNEDQAS